MAGPIPKPALVALGVGVLAVGVTATVVASRKSPTAKALVRESAKAYDRFRIALAETREDFEDVLAEARMETEAALHSAFAEHQAPAQQPGENASDSGAVAAETPEQVEKVEPITKETNSKLSSV